MASPDAQSLIALATCWGWMAHSSYDWHPDPEPQFVITLSGTLEFATPDGETFVVRPGDVLLAEDHIGKGHKWRLIDDQPWRRAYVVLKPGAKDSFVAKKRAVGRAHLSAMEGLHPETLTWPPSGKKATTSL